MASSSSEKPLETWEIQADQPLSAFMSTSRVVNSGLTKELAENTAAALNAGRTKEERDAFLEYHAVPSPVRKP